MMKAIMPQAHAIEDASVHHLQGILIVGTGVFAISFDAVLVRLAQTDGWNVAFWRGAFIALSLGLFLAMRQGRGLTNALRIGGWAAFISALLFAVTGLLFVLSIMHTQAANTVVILSAAPLFAALFTRLRLGEGVHPRTGAAIVVAFAGVFIVFAGAAPAKGQPLPSGVKGAILCSMNTIRLLFIWLLITIGLLNGCAGLYTWPDPPHISLADLRLVDMGLFEQRYRLRLRIQNPNSFALPIRGMDYALHLNGKEFARGVSPQATTVPPFGEQVVEVDVISNLARVLDQFLELGNQHSLRYQLSGGLRLENALAKIPFAYQGEIPLSRGIVNDSQ